MIKDIDFSAYCAGHLSGRPPDSRITALPHDFVTEAEALGAVVHRTQSGFKTVQYLFEAPEALYSLPNLADSEPVRRVLEQIRAAPADKTVLLKVNGPYSILASLTDPASLYRRLIKYSSAVHQALDRITCGLTDYLCMAVVHGASIISLADPYANLGVLGEKRYREFAAPYLLALLKNIVANFASKINGSMEKPNTVIHLCPHNSVPLVRFGYMHIQNIAVNHDSYIGALISLTRPPGFRPDLIILGDQCVYARDIEKLVIHYFC
jgi:hypothetical protein